MANYVDEAIAARKSGYDETQGFFDRQTMRKAGQAMAQGNRAGAAGELYGAGMIDAGRTLEQEGRNIEADTRKARMEDQDLANNERKQKAEFLKQAATVLRQIPTDARAEAFTGKVAPALKAMGIPDDIIAQAGQHLDDTSLQTFIGEVDKAAEQYTLAPGSKRFDANGRLIAEAPFAPQYRSVGPGDTLVEVGGGAGGGGDFGSHIGPMLEREGGFVASDGASGAPANFGINQRANPDIDVRNLTRDQAAQLYKERYWDAVGADQIPPEARAAVFDAAVNQGVDTAKQMWQQSGGDLQRFNDLRLERYRQTPGYDQYGESWRRRVAETGGGGGTTGGARVVAQGQPKPTNEAAVRKEFQTLRKEWNQLEEVKAFKDVSQSYKQVRALAKPGATAADDIALTFSFMKMLDPGSVVREGEYALVGRAAGLPDQVIMGLQRIDSGKGLTPAIRAKLVEAAAKIMIQRRESLDNIAGQYRQLATDMGANPDLLVDAPGSWRARITPEKTNRVPLDKIFGN